MKKWAVFVDDEDYDELNRYEWSASISGDLIYAHRRYILSDGTVTKRLMHRLIMKAKNGDMIDHIDHNGLNNQKSNLRFCTPLQNSANARPNKCSKTGFRGVCVLKDKTYKAQISLNGSMVELGKFSTPEEAAKIYNERAKEVFGDFAYLNNLAG
jgi:hypothetical protein